MIYIDLDLDVIDLTEDLWWVFHLKEIVKPQFLSSLIGTFSEYEILPMRERIDEDDFQVIFHDENSGIITDMFSSTEAPLLYLGMHRSKVLPPHSLEAQAFADRFLEYGKLIYRFLNPKYGFAENLNTYVTLSAINAHKLTHVCWAQFLTADFVQEVGRDILMNAPGWRNENLGDGGILYVLAATPFLYRGPRQYWQQARDFFTQYGFSSLKWSDQPD